MEPISYTDACTIQASGSFSFILAGEQHPVKRQITQEFYYGTKKLRPSPIPVLAFMWCSDPGSIPEWKNPQGWCKHDHEKGWLAV